MQLKTAHYITATSLNGNVLGSPFRANTCEDARFQVITYGNTTLVDDDMDPMTPDIPVTTYPKGAWTLEASEDGQVEKDIRRGTDNAKWVVLPMSGDVTVVKTPGASGITVNAADVTLDGSAEANFLIKVKTPYSYLRLRWTENASDDGTCDVFVSGRGA